MLGHCACAYINLLEPRYFKPADLPFTREKLLFDCCGVRSQKVFALLPWEMSEEMEGKLDYWVM